ncbi:hypothetical protein TH1_149 [Shewanella phage Thanatos-1]|nr:hypothetical protein TH1_149 [Shewanella phage Thanatos-1]
MKLITIAQIKQEVEEICSKYPNVNYSTFSHGDYSELYKIRAEISKNEQLYYSLMHYSLSDLNSIDVKNRHNICGHINDFISRVFAWSTVCIVATDIIGGLYLDLFKDISSKWEYYSKSHNYPVPPNKSYTSSEKDISPRKMFWDKHNANRLWEGEYGALREELLQFSLDYVSKKFD